jgi:hypothetical protein
MEQFFLQAQPLLSAFQDEALSRVPDCRLVSVEFEPLADNASGAIETELRVLKASSRVCFIQGTLKQGTVPVLKARAIFRKK